MHRNCNGHCAGLKRLCPETHVMKYQLSFDKRLCPAKSKHKPSVYNIRVNLCDRGIFCKIRIRVYYVSLRSTVRMTFIVRISCHSL